MRVKRFAVYAARAGAVLSAAVAGLSGSGMALTLYLAIGTARCGGEVTALVGLTLLGFVLATVATLGTLGLYAVSLDCERIADEESQ